jgi:ankyrin repeat protein
LLTVLCLRRAAPMLPNELISTFILPLLARLALWDHPIRRSAPPAPPLPLLHKYAKEGSFEKVKDLLAKGCDVNQVDWRGRTALMTACTDNDGTMGMFNRHHVCSLLLEAQAEVNVTDEDGNTAIHLAAAATQQHRLSALPNHPNHLMCAMGLCVQRVLESRGQHAMLEHAWTLSNPGACHGDVLGRREVVLQKNNAGDTALEVARRVSRGCVCNIVDMLEFQMWLQSAPILIIAASESEWRVHEVGLSQAKGRANALEVVKRCLATENCEVEARDMFGNTALMHAVAQSLPDHEIIDALLEASADVDATRSTPLHLEADYHRPRGHEGFLIETMIPGDFGNGMYNSDSWTALHYAAYHGAASAAKRLLNAGAQVDARDNRSRTPLDVARIRARSGKDPYTVEKLGVAITLLEGVASERADRAMEALLLAEEKEAAAAQQGTRPSIKSKKAVSKPTSDEVSKGTDCSTSRVASSSPTKLPQVAETVSSAAASCVETTKAADAALRTAMETGLLDEVSRAIAEVRALPSIAHCSHAVMSRSKSHPHTIP